MNIHVRMGLSFPGCQQHLCSAFPLQPRATAFLPSYAAQSPGVARSGADISVVTMATMQVSPLPPPPLPAPSCSEPHMQNNPTPLLG